jgi:hypothetical protein
MEHRGCGGRKRIGRKIRGFEFAEPFLNQPPQCQQVQPVQNIGIRFQILPGEAEESGGGSEPVFLQVNKGPRQLNQAFVEVTFRPLPLAEPDRLDNVVRLEEKLVIKTLEISQIMRIEVSSPKCFDQLFNFAVFFTHVMFLSMTPTG